MENPEFLKDKYNLHTAREVESAAKRTEARTGEKVSEDPADRIQNYLNRFQEILDRKDPRKREQGIKALKRVLYDKHVIKPEDIPEGYFDNQRGIAREQGHGDIKITDQMREQHSEVIIADQRSTLDTWVNYLSSPDAIYPDWLKYYAMRSVLALGEYDKDKKQFTKRSKGTTKPFPDLNREALSYVLGAIEKKHQGEKPGLIALEIEDKEKFEKILQGENFAKLYAWAIEKITPTDKKLLTVTDGKWVKYNQGSDHMPLVESLQGHGTNWCTAGESTAKAQLGVGNFYVYYSLDEEGEPNIPRVAIRMEDDKIAEVRGIADKEQNMDSYIVPVAQEKLKEFPDGKQFEKKVQDMKTLTAIERKAKAGEQLTKDDLVFLYGINSTIESFGYKSDPRIVELLAERNPEADMPIVFECTTQQIARNIDEINEDTKVYVGPLAPGIFDVIQKHSIEYIYTSFPEEHIRKVNVEIGGKNGKTLLKELREKGVNINEGAEDMMKSKDFVAGKKSESTNLIRLKVSDLGFPKDKYPTTDEVYKRIEELGLELCPAEVGPHYRLQYPNQPLNEWVRVGMKQITDRNGRPHTFDLEHPVDGLWLDDDWVRPDSDWPFEHEVVFRLRELPAKSESTRDRKT